MGVGAGWGWGQRGGYQENFLGTQKRVQIIYGHRAIGVRFIEILLFVCLCSGFTAHSTQWGHVERG